MNLGINGQKFLVTGASDGFGREVARTLFNEGAHVIAVARNKEKLDNLKKETGGNITIISGDLFDDIFLDELLNEIKNVSLDGVFVNAGGPSPMGFLESEMTDWDRAYKTVVRWKLKLVKTLLPQLIRQKYGRILFLESASVFQPVDNLVLSNSLRMAIAGAAKTLSFEVADKGITVNLIAPGFHKTSAVDRIINKKSESDNISNEEAEQHITSSIPVGYAGNPAHLASLAVWLLSPLSDYVTGKTYILDGGNTRFSLG